MKNLNHEFYIRLFLYFLISFIFIDIGYGQEEQIPDKWTQCIEGEREHETYAIAKDGLGQIITVGKIEGNGILKNHDDLETIKPGRTEAFVIKYGTTGEIEWEENFGISTGVSCPSCTGPVIAWDVAVAPNDDFYVGGQYRGKIDFRPDGIGGTSSTSGSTDGFIAKFDKNNEYKWQYQIGGSENGFDQDAIVRTMVVDVTGNLYAAGTFISSAKIIGRDGNLDNDLYFPDNSFALETDIWIAKFSPTGKVLWHGILAGNGRDLPLDIKAVPGSGVVLTGSYERNLSYYKKYPAEEEEFPSLGNGRSNAFLAHFNGAGDLVAQQHIESDAGVPVYFNFSNGMGNEGNKLVVDKDNSIFITGAFVGNAIIAKGQSGEMTISSEGQKDIFIAKLDAFLRPKWFKGIGGSGFDTGEGIDIQEDTLYVGGRFGRELGGSINSTITFDKDGTKEKTITSKGREDIMIAELNKQSGDFITVDQYGGKIEDRIVDLVTLEEGISFGGYFASDTLIIATDTLRNNLPGLGGTNAFVSGQIQKPLLIVNVIHEANDFQETAEYVELWARENNGDEPLIKKLIPEIDDKIAGKDFSKVVFYSSELAKKDIYDCYLLREDKTLIGKINLQYKDKNRRANRKKEVIITLHNDLLDYRNHPIDGAISDPTLNRSANDDWAWLNYYKYDYKKPLTSTKGEKVTTCFYPVSLLIPPVNEEAEYALDNIEKDNKPVVFIHGYTDIDNEWGLEDTKILSKNADKNSRGFAGDYARTSITSRVSVMSKNTSKPLDCWEFYYPPEQDWAESGYLLRQAIDKVHKIYDEQKVSLVSYSMGGLVSGAYISGVSKKYILKSAETFDFEENIDYDDKIDLNLLLASPQHGSFLANRGYWQQAQLVGEFADKKIAQFKKDPYAPGVREAAIGSNFIYDLIIARQKTPPGPKSINPDADGVKYLSIVGTKDRLIQTNLEDWLSTGYDVISFFNFAKSIQKIARTVPKEKVKETLLKELPPEKAEKVFNELIEEFAKAYLSATKPVDFKDKYNAYIDFMVDLVLDGPDGVAVKKLGKFLDTKDIIVLEARNHSDNTVSISSGSLLNYGVDLAVLDGFSHGTFTQEYDKFERSWNILPKMITDFIVSGELSVISKGNCLQYIDANKQDEMVDVPNDFASPSDLIRLDVGLPLVEFKLESGVTWIPEIRSDKHVGTRFQFEIDVDQVDRNLRAGYLYNYNSQLTGNYRSNGMYLYYGGNNFTGDVYKSHMIGRPAFSGGPRYKSTPLFLGFQETKFNFDKLNIGGRNPFSILLERPTVLDALILSEGPGWHLPQLKQVELNVYLGYEYPYIDVTRNKNAESKVPYQLLTAKDKFRLNWSQTTYNEFFLNENALYIINSTEARDQTTSSMSEENFNGDKAGFVNKNTNSRNNEPDLANWIDGHIETASFVLTYDSSATLPDFKLIDPSGTTISAADTSQNIFWTHQKDLRVAYFNITEPIVGRWDVLINGVSSLPPDSKYHLSYPVLATNNLNVSIFNDTIVNGNGLVITAELEYDSITIENDQMLTYFYDFQDSIYTTEMKDDGVWPDIQANDHKYAGVLMRPDTFAYEVVTLMWGKMEQDNFIRQNITEIPDCELRSDFTIMPDCVGQEIGFLNATQLTESVYSVLWDFGDSTTSNRVDAAHIYDSAGIYNVKLEMITVNGCKNTIEKSITVHDPPSPKIESLIANCENGEIVLDAGSGYTTYFWSTIDTTQTIENERIESDSSYFAIVLDSIGCLAITDTVKVENSSCPIPQSTSIQNQADSLVQFSWNAGDYAGDTWQIAILPQNETPSDSGLTVVDTLYEKTDLAPGSYDFYLRSMCGATLGGCWDGPYEFSVGGENELIALAGNITTEYGEAVQEVGIKWSELDSTLTNEQGNYSLGNFRSGSDVMIEPYKNDYPVEKVSNADVIQVLQHILEIEKLDSPYKIIAADANRSGHISISDLIGLQKIILKIDAEFPHNTSWRFVPKDYEFQNPTNPLLEDFREIADIKGVIQSRSNLDFVGIRIGDVTYGRDSLVADAGTSRSIEKVDLNIENQFFKKGETIIIPVYGKLDANLLGYQLEYTFNPNQLQFVGLNAGQGQENIQYATHQLESGKLPLMWVNYNQVVNSINHPTLLHQLKFIAKTDGRLDAAISLANEELLPELYTSDNGGTVERKTANINFEEQIKVASTVSSSIQVFPNPVKQQLMVQGLNASIDANWQVELFDAYGKSVKILPIQDKLSAQIRIPMNSLMNGTYWLRIKIGETVLNKKVVKVE